MFSANVIYVSEYNKGLIFQQIKNCIGTLLQIIIFDNINW